MKKILVLLVLLSFLANTAQSQVKFHVKKLNADSLVSLIPQKEGVEKIDILNLLSNVICRKDIDSSISIANNCFDAYDMKNRVLEMLGWRYYIQGEYDKAIFNFPNVLKNILANSHLNLINTTKMIRFL